jgi:hypothetical protein
MPRKKQLPVNEQEPAPVNRSAEEPPKKTEPEKPAETPSVKAASNEEPEVLIADQTVQPDIEKKPARPNWIWVAVSVIAGLTAGFILCYIFFVNPLTEQLTAIARIQNSGLASSNQIKSDFSNMQLRQQEMEIRYRKSAAQLENANLYIFLLQMKEKTTLAQLFVEQKKGLEARETLAEIKTIYNNISPFIEKKDKDAAMKLDTLLTTAVQDLTADPETAALDLEDISSQLQTVELALFKLE